jgi:outer membrane lipoprotein carrier protein
MVHALTMFAALLALLAALLPAPPATRSAAADAELARSLVRRIEERQARAADLVARFTQSYRSGMLGRAVTERGVVSIKRPGRMRWEYKDPEEKLFVSDGRTFYFYVPADRQVIVSEQDDQRSLAARLLSGRGGLLDEFDASLEPPAEEGVVRLKLVPRQEEAEVARAYVDAEPTGRIRSILIDDAQGNRTRFRFENVRENTGLDDRLFRFEVPKGVEVVHG